MGKTELLLKSYILEQYKSILEFSKSINMPYSTLDNIFKRGVLNANIDNIFKICGALNISAEELGNGRITLLNPTPSYEPLIDKIKKLNYEGQSKAIEYIDDLIASGKYNK